MASGQGRYPISPTGEEPIVSTIIITVDSKEPNWLFASTVRAMRRSLDITEAQLARASGIARQRIEAIEAGGATTGAERQPVFIAYDLDVVEAVGRASRGHSPSGTDNAQGGALNPATPPDVDRKGRPFGDWALPVSSGPAFPPLWRRGSSSRISAVPKEISR
jgi:hypothetical protein